jgi:hypothetical protein
MCFDDLFRNDRPDKMLQITPSRLVAAFTRTLAGGPLKPGFGLSGAVQSWKESSRSSFAFSRGARLDLHRSSQPGDITRAGPSASQIIAFAMICSGRDDRVGEI